MTYHSVDRGNNVTLCRVKRRENMMGDVMIYTRQVLPSME
jgi:hypothetical protein